MRARYREADFVLADYFDLIAGSGFGAMVAADLTCGLGVSGEVLGRRRLLPGKHAYDPAPFQRLLRERYATNTLALAWSCAVRARARTSVSLLEPPLGAGRLMNRC